MIYMFMTTVRTGFVKSHLGIKSPVAVIIDNDALVFDNIVVRAFKRFALIRADKNQFHMFNILASRDFHCQKRCAESSDQLGIFRNQHISAQCFHQ